MKVKVFGLAAVLAVASAIPATAHHSFAMFDRDKTVTMEGVVKDFQWTNPHSFLDVMVTNQANPQAAPVLWTLELGALHSLADQGWRPKSVLPGDKVTVTIHPAKDGTTYAQFVSVVLPSGKKMGQGAAVRPNATENPDN